MSHIHVAFLLGFIISLPFGILIHNWKSKRNKDKFLSELETWLTKEKDKKYQNYFEINLEKQFSEFKDWREKIKEG